jgi:hypothetical protein
MHTTSLFLDPIFVLSNHGNNTVKKHIQRSVYCHVISLLMDSLISIGRGSGTRVVIPLMGGSFGCLQNVGTGEILLLLFLLVW